MAVKNKIVSNIYIDEGGDFGLKKSCSDLYIISFVLVSDKIDVENKEKYLNNKLNKLGFNGMIHTSPLISNRGIYTHYSIETKKDIFWYLMNFLHKSKIKIYTIVVDKRFINNISQLENKIHEEIINFLNDNKDFFKKYDEINIYYDNGQENLTKIFDKSFNEFSNINRITQFDKINNRLFQIADMLTFIEKLFFKLDKKNNLTKSEKLFFSRIELNNIEKILKNKSIRKTTSHRK